VDTHEAPDLQGERKLEVGHVLFMDVVGYSKLMIEDQRRTLEELRRTVSELQEFRAAAQENRLIRLPTGDGMALVFFGDPEAPLRASVNLSRALRDHHSLGLRMGIHSGPVYRVEDINANMNVAGGGVNLAQRVMDCGDAGHILVSEDSARFFAQVGEWADRLHDVGKTRVKHGLRLHLYSLVVSEIGNPRLPLKLRREKLRRQGVGGAVLAGVFAASAVLLWEIIRRPLAEPAYTRITTNSAKHPLNAAAISPNGQYLAYVEPKGILIRDIRSGEDKPLPTPEGASLASPNWSLAWFPDSSRLLVSGPAGPERVESVWLFHPFVGNAPQRIAEKAWAPAVSPDGLRVAFIDAETERGVWAGGAESGDRTLLFTAPEGNHVTSVCWSPAGSRLAFLDVAADPREDYIGTVDTADPSTKPTTVLRGEYLVSGPESEFSELLWLADERIVFEHSNVKGSKGSNLWAVPVDSKSGQVTGQQRQITQEVDYYQSSLSSTSDGNRLAFLRIKSYYGIKLGHLDHSGGMSLGRVEEFVSEESNNWASGWTPDSKFVLFTSDRKGGMSDIFRQALSGGGAQVLLTSVGVRSNAVALSDGTSYLYWSWTMGPGHHRRDFTLKRLPLPLGPPVSLLESKPYESEFRCALAAPICFISEESKEGLNFSKLDIQEHGQKPTASLKLPVADGYDWDLSPDGGSIAAVHISLLDDTVRILSLVDRTTRQLALPGWGELEWFAWAASGNGFYVAADLPKSSALLYADLNGKVDVLWRSEAEYLSKLAPSPDGKHIAFTVESSVEGNAWVIENF
jgi:Tol biopolymer transport system component/class 3 adenylate cyclase